MKPKHITTFSLLLLVAFIGCTKAGDPMEALHQLKELYSEKNYSGAEELLTSETRSVMAEIGALEPELKKNGFGFYRFFAKASEWDVLSKRIDESTAVIKVKYTEHPIENIKGISIKFTLKKDGGKWKWDMEEELRFMLSALRRR